MNKLIQQALFILPIAALIVAPFVIDHKAKGNVSNKASSGSYSSYTQVHDTADFDLPHVVEKQQYAMLEPFADHAYFADQNNPMNPAVWMYMMVRMMNHMQITQMMQQMAAMSTLMTNQTAWTNPYMMMPNPQTQLIQQPMSPEEYEKWYKQQQKKFEANK